MKAWEYWIDVLYLFCIRVQAEAEEVLEGKNGVDTMEDLKKLQYTQQVWFYSELLLQLQ